MTSQIKNMRSKMFPEIKNWSNPQNHLRNAHPNELDFYHFLWFHPYAFTFLKIGMPSIFMITCTVLALKNARFGLSMPLILPAIGLVVCLIWLFKEIRKLEVHLKTNMYDILMKD